MHEMSSSNATSNASSLQGPPLAPSPAETADTEFFLGDIDATIEPQPSADDQLPLSDAESRKSSDEKEQAPPALKCLEDAQPGSEIISNEGKRSSAKLGPEILPDDDPPIPINSQVDAAVSKGSKIQLETVPRGTNDTPVALEATLVHDPPLYDAVQVEEQQEQSMPTESNGDMTDHDQSWWKKNKCLIFFGSVFVIAAVAGTVGGLFASQDGNVTSSQAGVSVSNELVPTQEHTPLPTLEPKPQAIGIIESPVMKSTMAPSLPPSRKMTMTKAPTSQPPLPGTPFKRPTLTPTLSPVTNPTPTPTKETSFSTITICEGIIKMKLCVKSEECAWDKLASTCINAPFQSEAAESTGDPSESPMQRHTESPTKKPSPSPTKLPTKKPSLSPTKFPTKKPSSSPTNIPTKKPSSSPTKFSTKKPTSSPTEFPTKNPVSMSFQPFKPTSKPTPLTSPNPTPTNACGSMVQKLLSPSCDNCMPKVAIDGDNALVRSEAWSITMLTHINGLFDTHSTEVVDNNKNRGPVAMSGNIIAAGFVCGVCAGAVYTYEQDEDGSWDRSNIIVPSEAKPGIFVGSQFGASVALDGNAMIVGATGHPIPGGYGAAFIYIRRAKNTWSLGAEVKPSGKRWDFGKSVSIKGDVAVVGDHRFGNTLLAEGINNDNAEKGAVFLYMFNTVSGSVLSDFAIHKAEYCKRWFGHSVALTDDRDLFVGCPIGDLDSGVVYFYNHPDNGDGEFSSSPQKVISPSDGGSSGDNFGWDIVTDGNFAAIGTQMNHGGKVYVYTRIDGDWTEVTIIESPNGEEYFGESLALSGSTLVVSSRDNAFSYSLADCNI